MTHTTAPEPFDVAWFAPGIARYVGTTARLHPRPGDPDVKESHLGGPLLWPAAEPWPRCDSLDCDVSPGDPLVPGAPLVALAQLCAADFPEIRFPAGADVVQVLWCTGRHADVDIVQVFWRQASDVLDVLADPPQPATAPEWRGRTPRPCVLDPERVLEYPWFGELPPAVRESVWVVGEPADEGADCPSVYSEVSTAPGFKVGGSMNWPNSGIPDEPDASHLVCVNCDAPQTLLLQVDTYEWFPHESMPPTRWWPLEDRHLVPHTPEFTETCAPTSASVGGESYAGIYVCTADPTHRAACWVQ